jgi:apolipoprotein D and lipocalin family protein
MQRIAIVSMLSVFLGACSGYAYVLICGLSREYLWILARTPTLPRATLQQLVQRARQPGFATDKLIYVQHNSAAPG